MCLKHGIFSWTEIILAIFSTSEFIPVKNLIWAHFNVMKVILMW